jgi:hypothetical protein
VRGFIIDFEAAIWGALKDTYPGIQLHGCNFHWSQAVWGRKVQEPDLSKAYKDDKGTNKYLRRLVILPYLPEEHIVEMFHSLKRDATDEKKVIDR